MFVEYVLLVRVPTEKEKQTQKSGYILFVPVLIMCVKDVVQGGFAEKIGVQT